MTNEENKKVLDLHSRNIIYKKRIGEEKKDDIKLDTALSHGGAKNKRRNRR